VEEAGSLSFLVTNADAAPITVGFDNGEASNLNEILAATKDTAFTTTSPVTAALNNAFRLGNSATEFVNKGAAGFVSASSVDSSAKYVYVTGSSTVAESTFADALVTPAVTEIQTVLISGPFANDDNAIRVDFPNGTFLYWEGEDTNTVANMVSGLKTSGQYNPEYVDFVASGNNIVFTFAETGPRSSISVTTSGTTAPTAGAASETRAGTNDSATAASTRNFGRTLEDSNTLTLSTTETEDSVALKVRAWLDANGNGVVDFGEKSSDVVDVVFYAPGTFSATTTMQNTIRGTGEQTMSARVVLNNGINPNFVANQIEVEFYKDGVLNNSAAEDNSITALTGAINFSATHLISSSAADLVSGIYHARAKYNYPSGEEPTYFVGARSVALDLRDGSNTLVDGVEMRVAADANVVLVEDAQDTIDVRVGTKAVTITAQALDDPADLKASNIQVRATVTGIALGATSSVTVTGATGTITEEDDEIVATGFTNASGQVSFTINNTVGAKDDELNVLFEIKDSNGVWIKQDDITGVEVLWQTAVLSSFEPSAEVVSGSTVNVSFEVADQWGVGLDSSATLGRYSVHVIAYVAGVEKPATYSETKTTTNGVAAFSFTNFVTLGSSEQILAKLYNGNEAVSDTVAIPNPVYVDVFNLLATDSITLSSAYENRVVYADYVVGDLDTASVFKAATDAGVLAAIGDDTNTTAEITGTVLNVNNQGQPGAAVTVAVPGALLWDEASNVLAKDTISTVANSLGFFSVSAVTQKANAKGATITVTSGGKSATSLLKTYLPDYQDNESDDFAKNWKLSWTLPTTIVKDTTYSVTATLTDVWGNPIRTLWDEDEAEDVPAFVIAGEGALLVNGTDEIRRNTNADGQMTFFIRSVATIGGPGTLSVTLGDTIYYATGGPSNERGNLSNISDEFEDNPNTSWNESLWSNSLTTTVNILDKAPTATTGRVNVGSFNGKLVVYAADLAGARISWKVGGNWGSAVAVGNTLNRFDRPTPRRGVTVSVEIYVNGVKQLTKSVVTR
jgi:hypothetical protein